MKEDYINLAGGTPAEKKTSPLVRAPAFLFFAIVFLISALILGYSLFLKLSSSSLEAKARDIRAQISTLAQKKEKLLITAERVSSIKNIVNSRANIDATITSILEILPESFSVDSISGNVQEINITISSDNLAEFAILLSENVPDAAKDKKLGIKSVKIDNFSQSSAGYSLSLVFLLNSKKQ